MDEDKKIKEIVLELESQYVKTSGEQRFVYNGQSMSPILKDGDCLLIMNRRPLKFSLGDLVVYKSGDNFVVHRFLCYRIQGEKRVIITKADNSSCKDFPFGEDRCVGKVIKIFRFDVGLDFRQHFSIRILNYIIGVMSFVELLTTMSFPRRIAVKIEDYFVTERIRK